jgi:hypothetical protein
MSKRGFDAARLKDDPPFRFVALEDLARGHGSVSNAAKPIGVAQLVTIDLSLVTAVELLTRSPNFFFVLRSNQLAGIVTISDLQRPAVSMVVFSLILAAETALNRRSQEHHGNDWNKLLRPHRARHVIKVFERYKQHNVDLTLVDCPDLDDRLHLIGLSAGGRQALGLSTDNDLEKQIRRLKHVRNTLAHGGGLLDAEHNPSRAITLFADVRRFAESAWRSAGLAD